MDRIPVRMKEEYGRATIQEFAKIIRNNIIRLDIDEDYGAHIDQKFTRTPGARINKVSDEKVEVRIRAPDTWTDTSWFSNRQMGEFKPPFEFRIAGKNQPNKKPTHKTPGRGFRPSEPPARGRGNGRGNGRGRGRGRGRR